MSTFKGFNKVVGAKRSSKILSLEKAHEGKERKLEILRSGKLLVSAAAEKYKYLNHSPDVLVKEIMQALRFGASVQEIREACEDHKLLESAKWSAGRETLMSFAKERGVSLSSVAHIFGLESDDTRVVSSEDIAAE